MWIILSLIYALTNAVYTTYNDARHYDGYILGIWRGFGVSLLVSPLLFRITLNFSPQYLAILTFQGILIGLYVSHIFYASSRYGGHASSGFMSTSLLITVLLWWLIEPQDLKSLLNNPPYFITLILILAAYSTSFWQMMQVHINITAEKYLYPAVLALSLMSITTRYIALKGGPLIAGIISYLTISCFISGIYNTIFYLKNRHLIKAPLPHLKDGLWLILFSTILITAKTIALRLAPNPAYVVAVLLVSPIFAELIKKHRIVLTPALLLTTFFLILLLIFVT